MEGLHLTADLHGCQYAPHGLTNAAASGAWCVQAVKNAGLQPVAELFHSLAAAQRLSIGGVVVHHVVPARGSARTVVQSLADVCIRDHPSGVAHLSDRFGPIAANIAVSFLPENRHMIIVHHLNESRSQRVLWLLEELGVAYEIRHYARDAVTRLAPPELLAVHPLGKSPVIQEGDQTVIESGAIVDYLIRRHGGAHLQPAAGTPDFEAYNQWLHYAEGSAMLPLLLKLYTSRLGEAAAPLNPRIDSELANHLGYVDRALQGRSFLVGDSLTGADIQMSFVAEAARGLRTNYPAMDAWLRGLQARPAYHRALERGGPYSMAI